MADNMNFSISENLVKPIIDAKIQSAIVAELGKAPEMVAAAVAMVLSQKVDDKGKPTTSSYYNNQTFLQYMCNEELQSAARAALVDHMKSAQPLILAAMKKEITKNTNKIAIAMVDALVKKTTAEYGFKFEMKLNHE